MLPHDALGIVRTGEQKNLTDIRYDYKSQAFVSHAGGGNVHAELVAHVGSGATGTANVQLGGHGSTVGSGSSHVSNGSSNGGSHGSAGGSGGAVIRAELPPPQHLQQLLVVRHRITEGTSQSSVRD
jgi:hypothetical protein